MIVCGLDQALRKSGAAVLDGDRFVYAEAFTSSGDSHGEMFASFRVWWRTFLKAHDIERVALEQPLRSDLTRTTVEIDENANAFGKAVVRSKAPMTSMETLLGLYGTRGVAVEVCASLNIRAVEVNNQEWRAMIHGTRRAPKGTKNTSEWWKQQALARCEALGWHVPSKDAAEAALIAEWLRVQLSPMGRRGDLFEGRAA